MHSSAIRIRRNRKALHAFHALVYRATKQIPKGRVATYAEIARAIGSPNSARAVGNALNRNPFPEVPCHRVVRSGGVVGGYAHGGGAKARRLAMEGVAITSGKIDLAIFGVTIKRS